MKTENLIITVLHWGLPQRKTIKKSVHHLLVYQANFNDNKSGTELLLTKLAEPVLGRIAAANS